jgi:hypothetical protein
VKLCCSRQSRFLTTSTAANTITAAAVDITAITASTCDIIIAATAANTIPLLLGVVTANDS